MKMFSVYSKSDGKFTGKVLSLADASEVAANLGENEAAAEGVFDHLSKRIDQALSKIVDYVPPAPDVNSKWDESSKRWVTKPEVETKRGAIIAAQVEIERLERKQHRAMREALMNVLDLAARKRLTDTENAIKAQRAIIQANSS